MKKLNKIIIGALLSLGVIVLSFLLNLTSFLDSSQQELSNSLYATRETQDEIVIIGIDEKSLQSVEEGGLGRFNRWPRYYHSSVIQNLNDAGAEVIMLDVLFDQGDMGISNDSLYLEWLENGENPDEFMDAVLSYAQSPHPDDLAFAEALSAFDNLYLIKSGFGYPELIDNKIYYEDDYSSIDLIDESSHSAMATIQASDQESKSGITRSIPPILNVDGVDEEHITLQLTRDYLNITEAGEYHETDKTYQLNDQIQIPIEEGQMIINYASEPYDWSKISYVDVFYNQFPSEMVDGKIVLIGPYTNSLNDFTYTPLSQDIPTPGIEIHANAIQMLLDQEFLEYQDSGPFIALVAGIALLSVFAFLYLPIWGGLIVLIVEIALFPFYAQWRFDKGVIINLIWPVFAMVASYLVVMAYRNVTEFREKRKLRNAFAHYVSPELVNQITNSDSLALGGERRVMTTLFLDIENFTSLSEKLEPQEVVSVINAYFDAFAKEVMAHGGTVDKFEGDAIMALFGAPLKTEDHALKACQTAMAIRSKVGELNGQTGHQLNVRIGIATGECIVGNMGSEDRFDYTAMGDTVNTASRLEGGNKFYGTRVLVNAGTMEGSHEHIFFRRIDRVRLKGKAEAIDVYELMGANEAVSDEGKLLVNEWHSALEYYRNQEWDEVETRLRKILEKMPGDGPSTTYLERVEKLKFYPPDEWDGTWTFTSK